MKLANFRGRGLVAQENRQIKSSNPTNGQFYRLQLRTISASFTDTQQQKADRKMILVLFFLHLMNEKNIIE